MIKDLIKTWTKDKVYLSIWLIISSLLTSIFFAPLSKFPFLAKPLTVNTQEIAVKTLLCMVLLLVGLSLSLLVSSMRKKKELIALKSNEIDVLSVEISFEAEKILLEIYNSKKPKTISVMANIFNYKFNTVHFHIDELLKNKLLSIGNFLEGIDRPYYINENGRSYVQRVIYKRL